MNFWKEIIISLFDHKVENPEVSKQVVNNFNDIENNKKVLIQIIICPFSKTTSIISRSILLLVETTTKNVFCIDFALE